MAPRARRWLLLCLVAIFFAQTWMVYADPVGRSMPPLSALASRGQALWRAHNCQSCHQIYGFGGFLGPDLTNAAARLTPARLDAILTAGSDRMPAFGFGADERGALAGFLAEIDMTGVGQARVADVVLPRELLSQLIDSTASPDDELTGPERRGRDILAEQNCIDCHLPNSASLFLAPDLTTVSARLDRDALAAVLRAGVAGKAMPRFDFDPTDVDAVHASLQRMGRHAAALRAGFEGFQAGAQAAFADLPWFEYR